MPLVVAAQTAATNLDSLRVQARRATGGKRYAEGAALYSQQAQAEPHKSAKASAHYNAACYYALAGQAKPALVALKTAQKLGWNKASWARQDSDLTLLRQEPAYLVTLAKMQRVEDRQLDPNNAKLVTSDINLFWKAYDKAAKDTAHKQQIFQREYFDKGSVGLQDYYTSKILKTEYFVRNQNRKPTFYRAIRPNTLQIASMTDGIRAGFRKMKTLYPEARFPNVYFVIGRYNSGGTASSNGMLIGADQQSGTPGIPLSELNLWERNGLGSLAGLPGLVAHEHVHFLQKSSNDPSLLRGAINEGMCDFLAELTTGQNPNQRLQAYGKAHEKEIWADFKKEMAGNNWNNWIANASQETADKPADLGYFVGYQLCKAYCEEQPDQKQAVHDILNITDFQAFVTKSRYEEKLASR